MYAAIDLITDKLERQIRKHKTKVNRKFREKGEFQLRLQLLLKTADQLLKNEDELELFVTKRFDLKPMDSEEAILQMNMLGHDFYVFTNARYKPY